MISGALALGITYIISGLIAIGMAIYFFFINSNGLKSILLNLFFAWSAHYLIIGLITLTSFLTGHEIIPLDALRLMASIFVLFQLLALCRLYFYISRK